MDETEAVLPLLKSNNISLYSLDLSGKRPPPAMLKNIATALETNTHLHVLDLSENSLSDGDIAPLIEALASNEGVRELDLSGNADITDQTGSALVELIKDKNHTLANVKMAATSISETIVESIVFLMKLNQYPEQLKPMVYQTTNNFEGLFEFELTYDPSDTKVYNEESTQIVVDAFKNNTTITSIKLNRCCRSEQCAAVLAKLLAKSKHIKRVSLRENMLGDLAVKEIVAALQSNPENVVEDLDLGRNEISDEGCNQLAVYLELNHTLRVVALDHNQVTAAAKDKVRCGCALNCEPSPLKPLLPRLLANEPALDTLDLSGSEETLRGPSKGYYTNLGAKTVAASLRMNTVVHTLNFHNNHIGPEGARALGDLIAYNATITSIDISHNPLFDEGLRFLIDGLKANNSVSSFNVQDTGATERLCDDIKELCVVNSQPLPLKECLVASAAMASSLAVATSEQKNEHLTGCLNLSKRPSQPRGKLAELTKDSIRFVAKIIKENPGIVELDLSDNAIGDAGVFQVAEMLQNAKCKLQKVVLSNVGMTDAGVNALTEAVRCNYVIRVIHTTANSECSFKPQGLLNDALSLNQFVPAVKDMVPLLLANVGGVRTLDFNRTDPKQPPLGDDTSRILFSALKDNTHVTKISLANQGMSNRTVGYGCECLSVNKHIQELDLGENAIGPDGATLVAELLEINTTLRSLRLSKNNIMESGGVALLQALKTANRTLDDILVEDCTISEGTTNKIYAMAAFNGQPIEFRRQILERVTALHEIEFVGDASSGYLDDKSCRALQLAMSIQPHHVSSIALNHNHIKLRGFKTILKILEASPHVTSVSLANNLIEGSNNAIEEMAEQFLLKNEHIKKFDLSGNSVSDAGLARQNLLLRLNAESPKFRSFFFGAERKRLEKGAAQTAVDLPRCAIRSSSIVLLTELFGSDLGRISIFDLSNNNIDDAAVETLVEELATHLSSAENGTGACQALYLDGNNIGAKGAVALANYVWKSQSILIASVSRNPVSPGQQSSSLSGEEQRVSDGGNAENRSVDAINALAGITTKLQENLKLVGTSEEKQGQLLKMLHRDVSASSSTHAAAGSGIAAVRLAEQRRARYAAMAADGGDTSSTASGFDMKPVSDDEVLREALQMMPKRQPYRRGMYKKEDQQ